MDKSSEPISPELLVDQTKLLVEKCRSFGDNFIKRLHQKSVSTSTPIAATRSCTATTTDVKLDRGDSGFNELLSCTLNNETRTDISAVFSVHSSDKSSNTSELLSQADSLLQSSQFTDSESCSSQILDPTCSSQADSGVVDSNTSIAHTRDLPKPNDGLIRMQEYFDDLKKKCKIECVIGRRMGEEFVDIISEIYSIQLPCLSTILAYLDDKSLRRLTIDTLVLQLLHGSIHVIF